MAGSRRGSNLAAEVFDEWSKWALISVVGETMQDLLETNNSPTKILAETLAYAVCSKDGLFRPREIFDLPDDERQVLLSTMPEQRCKVLHHIYRLTTPDGTPSGVVVDEGQGGRGVIFFSHVRYAIVYCLTIRVPFCFLTKGPANPDELKERFIAGALWGDKHRYEVNLITLAENFFGEPVEGTS